MFGAAICTIRVNYGSMRDQLVGLLRWRDRRVIVAEDVRSDWIRRIEVRKTTKSFGRIFSIHAELELNKCSTLNEFDPAWILRREIRVPQCGWEYLIS